ncbi:MAG: ClpXP protease specificity-enhancing factor [Gammaproteobacteria bacterium]
MAARPGGGGGGGPDTASTRPYLLRAIYEWALDHDLTPQVLVDTGIEGAMLPDNFADGGRIALTIHPRAVKGLEMDNDCLRFSARFAGMPHQVLVPVAAVLAIYARENGRGIFFNDMDEPPPALSPVAGAATDKPPPRARKTPGARPRLKLVK